MEGPGANAAARDAQQSKTQMGTFKKYGQTGQVNSILHKEASVVSKQQALQSDGFDMTRRNLEHPFHSSPLSYQKFNHPKYRELKI